MDNSKSDLVVKAKMIQSGTTSELEIDTTSHKVQAPLVSSTKRTLSAAAKLLAKSEGTE